jgi:hypothetical protein
MGYTSKFTGEQIDALLEKAGQGGGGSASSFKYIDVTTISSMSKRMAVILLAYQWKVPDGIYMVGQTLMDGLYETLTPQITAASFDFSRKYKLVDGGVVTLGDQFNTLLPDFTEITEEEFYNLA